MSTAFYSNDLALSPFATYTGTVDNLVVTNTATINTADVTALTADTIATPILTPNPTTGTLLLKSVDGSNNEGNLSITSVGPTLTATDNAGTYTQITMNKTGIALTAPNSIAFTGQLGVTGSIQADGDMTTSGCIITPCYEGTYNGVSSELTIPSTDDFPAGTSLVSGTVENLLLRVSSVAGGINASMLTDADNTSAWFCAVGTYTAAGATTGTTATTLMADTTTLTGEYFQMESTTSDGFLLAYLNLYSVNSLATTLYPKDISYVTSDTGASGSWTLQQAWTGLTFSGNNELKRLPTTGYLPNATKPYKFHRWICTAKVSHATNTYWGCNCTWRGYAMADTASEYPFTTMMNPGFLDVGQNLMVSRKIMAPSHHSMFEIYQSGFPTSVDKQTLTSANTYYSIAQTGLAYTSTDLTHFTSQADATKCQLTFTGAYTQGFHTALTCSFDETTASTDYEWALFVNGNQKPSSIVSRGTGIGGGAAVEFQIVMHCFIELSPGDTLELKVSANVAGAFIRATHMNIFGMSVIGM